MGTTLAELADGLGMPVPAGRVRTKGWSGQVLERELGVQGNHGPDFAALGVELKSVPVGRNLVPLESTAVCHIDPVAIAGESWETSYARTKLAQILWIALEVPDKARSVGERTIALVRLWSPSPEEEAVLRQDFELFAREYYRAGRAAEITGYLGRVLQVRPKARNSADTRGAYGPDGRPVRLGKSGFYLRPDFVHGILRAAPGAALDDP